MSRRARSAVTGRFVKKATAKRHPRTTVLESTKKQQGTTTVTVARSAVDGRFVSQATAKRQPKTTVLETIKR